MNDTPVTTPTLSDYEKSLAELSIVDVFHDLYKAMTDSQDCWPADQFNGKSSYGPLFIRLAWHCSGSFRATDDKGGCAGGRIRFEPEASWDDNTNLDKARALLGGIKEKYGNSLSWGDLFVFAGTAAIMNMGGPVTEICAGRIDSADGTLSLPLGPSPEQIATAPCPDNGNCQKPLGASTLGLIYVNPEGIKGVPDPVPTAARIREVFSRMDFNDTETVALIGGGHAFGKCHGACTTGAGLPPNKQPYNPWPGTCGTGDNKGKGAYTFTSGFEGQWTSRPLTWTNEFFTFLLNGNYTKIQGDGGKYQWRNAANGFLMLTSDLALINDVKYKKIVETFANDITALEDAFGKAWEKLTTQGGTWATGKKCLDGNHTKTLVELRPLTTMPYTTEVNDSSAYQYQHVIISCISLFMLRFIF